MAKDFDKILKSSTSGLNSLRASLKTLMWFMDPPKGQGEPLDMKIYGEQINELRKALNELEPYIRQFIRPKGEPVLKYLQEVIKNGEKREKP